MYTYKYSTLLQHNTDSFQLCLDHLQRQTIFFVRKDTSINGKMIQDIQNKLSDHT